MFKELSVKNNIYVYIIKFWWYKIEIINLLVFVIIL